MIHDKGSIIFSNFLLKDKTSLFIHDDGDKSYLCGTITTMILVWMLFLINCRIFLKPVLLLFLAISLDPHHTTITSFLVMSMISNGAVLTSVSVRIPGLT
jgi:hypothetical protein